MNKAMETMETMETMRWLKNLQVLAGHLFLLHVGDRQPDTPQHPRAAQQLFRRRTMGSVDVYPLVNIQKAIENGHL